MRENQITEWKESWRDEYLKWICGFANAQGGQLVIGKDKTGTVTGLSDADKLMEDLPNKIRDLLGIMVDVNLRSAKGSDYLEIDVEPYPYPVSYKGRYYMRSGSTKQELKGAALDRFLLGRQGKHWDGVPVPNVSLGDLDSQALSQFRKRATQSKRMLPSDLADTDAVLIDKLKLQDGRYLKRAAVLLFHADPERFVTGTFIKIGFFRSDADLRFQDEIHGDLFSQTSKALDLLLTKYTEAVISYRGTQRVESYPVPEDALREALHNAVAHKDYASGVPIQISVYADKIMIWNPGQLPPDWTVKRLFEKHASQPYNPDVANAFFRAGMIEAWGRGIERIVEACRVANAPEPELRYEHTGLWVIFHFPDVADQAGGIHQGAAQETLVETTVETRVKTRAKTGVKTRAKTGVKTRAKTGVKTRAKTGVKILSLISENNTITREELAEQLGVSVKGIDWQIGTLKREGKLKRVGSARGGHWEVLE